MELAMINQATRPQNSSVWRTIALALVVLYLLGLVWGIWSWQSRAASIKSYESELAALQAHGISQPQARSVLRDELFPSEDPLARWDAFDYFSFPDANLLSSESSADGARSLWRWETAVWPRELMSHYTNKLSRAGWRVVAWYPDGLRFEYLRSQCDQSADQCQALPLYQADIKLSQDLSVVKTTIEIELQDLR
jgi:hypothetical protein